MGSGLVPAVAALAGASQSVFEGASAAARDVIVLTFVVSLGAGLVFLIVMALAGYAILGGRGRRAVLAHRSFVLIAGLIVPVLVLTILLYYGLSLPGPHQSP
jgi:cytochrome c oxidase subunit 2